MGGGKHRATFPVLQMFKYEKENGLYMSDKEIKVDSSGWLVDCRKVISPNCDTRATHTEVDLLVIHNISLPPEEFGGGYIEQLFTNNLNPAEHPYFSEIADLRVSSHLLIDRAGKITQFVSLFDRAWHAGESTWCERSNCNDYSIGIELEGSDNQGFLDEQYMALSEITKVFLKAFPKITPDRIVGHSDIAPGRKTDPGPYFDWGRYKSSLST